MSLTVVALIAIFVHHPKTASCAPLDDAHTQTHVAKLSSLSSSAHPSASSAVKSLFRLLPLITPAHTPPHSYQKTHFPQEYGVEARVESDERDSYEPYYDVSYPEMVRDQYIGSYLDNLPWIYAEKVDVRPEEDIYGAGESYKATNYGSKMNMAKKWATLSDKDDAWNSLMNRKEDGLEEMVKKRGGYKEMLARMT